MVLGSELCGAYTSYLLSKVGYDVALVDVSRRIGHRRYALPFSERALMYLTLEVGERYVLGECREIVVMVNIDGELKVRRMEEPGKLIDSSLLSEHMVADSEIEVFLSVCDVVLNRSGGWFTMSVKDPRGKTLIRSRVLVDTLPPERGASFEIVTGFPSSKKDASSSGMGISMAFHHGPLATEVRSGNLRVVDCPIAASVIRVGESSFEVMLNEPLRIGEGAGHVLLPWVGDGDLISARLGAEILLRVLGGSEPDPMIDAYRRLAARVKGVLDLLQMVTSSKADEVVFERLMEMVATEDLFSDLSSSIHR